jgi:S-adenosylmethionine:tRNA ribosyltransferase-isomerase
LEWVAREKGRVEADEGIARLFLRPGDSFRVIDALITNFHLPGSTPLILVAAFAGLDLMRRAYDEAVKMRYRFYSYGDAMLIL